MRCKITLFRPNLQVFRQAIPFQDCFFLPHMACKAFFNKNNQAIPPASVINILTL